MEPAYLAAMVCPRLVQRLGRLLDEAHAPRPSRRSDASSARHDVRAAQVLELDAVLERAQERVRRMQRLAVLAPDVPTGGERVERLQGAGGAEVLVGAAVHQLQELDRELDVAQPAGAELELAVGVASRDGVQHPSPHRLDIADEAVALGDLPDHRLDQRRGTRCPSARSPATGRALSRAWNSQVLAQRS